jgi:hypothetical protein
MNQHELNVMADYVYGSSIKSARRNLIEWARQAGSYPVSSSILDYQCFGVGGVEVPDLYFDPHWVVDPDHPAFDQIYSEAKVAADLIRHKEGYKIFLSYLYDLGVHYTKLKEIIGKELVPSNVMLKSFMRSPINWTPNQEEALNTYLKHASEIVKRAKDQLFLRLLDE